MDIGEKDSRANHLDHAGLQISIAQKLAVNQGFAIALLETILPKVAFERRCDTCFPYGEAGWWNDLVGLWITAECFGTTKRLLLDRCY